MSATLDQDKCAQRNRIAARKGFAAGPVRLMQSPVWGEAEEETLARGVGKLPKTQDEALSLINALRTGGEPLTAEQVYLHYAEAASGAFIADRYMFMAESTLRNIAKDAATGIAFMNSHATGGFSTEGQLPFGRTFCGRFETDTETGKQRSLLGVYMMRGVQPNGANGPSTDDLSASITGGSIFDVSVGLAFGDYICDVCGEDFNARGERGEYLCSHIPGTTYKMSEAEQKSQLARGVTKGRASYSYANGRMGEVSAVYDGAVPGAGFVKALHLARTGDLPEAVLIECRGAYEKLAKRTDFAPGRPTLDTPQELVEGILTLFGEPQGTPFHAQLDEALSLLGDCITRGGLVAAQRTEQGKAQALSPERRTQFTTLRAGIDTLLALAPTAEPDTARKDIIIRETMRLRAAFNRTRMEIK